MARAITLRVDGPTVDFKLFEKLLVDGMTELWQDSIAEFVKVVALDNLIHVDTGMSVASVAPLGRQVGLFTEVMAKARSGKSRSRPNGSVLGDPDEYITRSASAGAKLGEDAYVVTYPTPGRQTMTFKFGIVVYQYFIHESSANGFSGSFNYESLDKGREAMQVYFQANKTNPKYIPSSDKWIRLRSWVR